LAEIVNVSGNRTFEFRMTAFISTVCLAVLTR